MSLEWQHSSTNPCNMPDSDQEAKYLAELAFAGVLPRVAERMRAEHRVKEWEARARETAAPEEEESRSVWDQTLPAEVRCELLLACLEHAVSMLWSRESRKWAAQVARRERHEEGAWHDDKRMPVWLALHESGMPGVVPREYPLPHPRRVSEWDSPTHEW
jgi:hypothetical protein